MDSLTTKIKAKIRRGGRGSVFTPKDFLRLGTRAAVDKVLQRLVDSGDIRRLSRGIYDYPFLHPSLGEVAADPDLIAATIARQTGDLIYPSGAKAANLLGLSTQVPAKLSYVTTGPSKTKIVGNYTFELKHSPISGIERFHQIVVYVVHALLHLGKNSIDDRAISRLRSRIPDSDRKHLLKALGSVPGWLTPKLKEIAA